MAAASSPPCYPQDTRCSGSIRFPCGKVSCHFSNTGFLLQNYKSVQEVTLYSWTHRALAPQGKRTRPQHKRPQPPLRSSLRFGLLAFLCRYRHESRYPITVGVWRCCYCTVFKSTMSETMFFGVITSDCEYFEIPVYFCSKLKMSFILKLHLICFLSNILKPAVKI